MPALARGQTSNCALPVLDVWTAVSGVLTDVSELSFQIFDISDAAKQATPLQVYPATLGQRASVDVVTLCPGVGAGKISTGHFVATWAVPLDAAIGTHRVKWFIKLTPSSQETTFNEEFEVLPELTATGGSGYCTVASLRAEGVTTTEASDDWLVARIELASRLVDQATKQWFEARERTVTLDGTGKRALLFRTPIISIGAISVDGVELDPSEYVVYARHLSQGLLDPDDRRNPRVIRRDNVWTKGLQNITVQGVFGYTEPEGATFTQGTTPKAIEHVTKLLVLRERAQLSDLESRDEQQNRHRVVEQRTRDQSYKLGAGRYEGGRAVAGLTGDPAIDEILWRFQRPIIVEVF